MDNQDLNSLSEDVSEPRLNAGAVPSFPQPPLNDRETAGFYRAMLDEREKRRAVEKQLAEIQNAQEPSSPGPTDRDLSVTVYANNLRVSRRFAEREYGREVVAAVHAWAATRCDVDPDFNARMRVSADPYEAAKQVYDQEQAPLNVRDAAVLPLPPRSLADAPGNGAVGKPHVPVGDGNAYESLFK